MTQFGPAPRRWGVVATLSALFGACSPTAETRPRESSEPGEVDAEAPRPVRDASAGADGPRPPSPDVAASFDVAATPDAATPDARVADARAPDAAPPMTFTQLYNTYFGVVATATRIGCKGSKCHDSEASNSEKISFATKKACYDILTGRGYIEKDNLESQLIILLEEKAMPKDPMAKMNEADVAKIKAWIAAGALNN